MVTIEIQSVNGDEENIAGQLANSSSLYKTFESETDAMEWIRRNSKYTMGINETASWMGRIPYRCAIN